MTLKKAFFQHGARALNSGVAHLVPHSFLFAILLTFAAYLMGIFGAYRGPFDMIRFWADGFWNFLSFSMQMVLMVTAGFSVASVPIGRKVLRSLAAIPQTPRGAVMFLTGIVAVFSWLHWGIGIVAGAFLAREMGRRIPRIDYPLLVACAYIGMCAGNFGLFAPEPLAVSKAGHFLEKAIGVIPLEPDFFQHPGPRGVLFGNHGRDHSGGADLSGRPGRRRPRPRSFAAIRRRGPGGRGGHDRGEGNPPEGGDDLWGLAGAQPVAGLADFRDGVRLCHFLVLRTGFRDQPEYP